MGYLDSGYIAKFYVDEPDSPEVRRLAESLGEVSCAALGRAEVSAALHRKLREGVFGEAAFREVMAQFQGDCANGLWTWIPMTSRILAATVAAIREVPKSVFLRAADAIHLACARDSGFTAIYTGDNHMRVAATYFRVRAMAIQS
ncbi:MAG: type II toxin-antitoxin system VapC family toxin [Candidatus Rokuibacteriota bacterium]